MIRRDTAPKNPLPRKQGTSNPPVLGADKTRRQHTNLEACLTVAITSVLGRLNSTQLNTMLNFFCSLLQIT